MLVDQTNTAGTTRPHSDTRRIVLDANAAPGTVNANVGQMFMLTDGGIWSLALSTAGYTGGWMSRNGGDLQNVGAMRISELLSVAYDQLNGLLFGGAQDNGSSEQTVLANNLVDDNGDQRIDDLGELAPWMATSPFSGDGNNAVAVPVDTDGDGLYDSVLRFVLGNDLGLGSANSSTGAAFFIERMFTAGDTLVAAGLHPGLGLNGFSFNVTGVAASNTFTTLTGGLVEGMGPFLLRGFNVPLFVHLVANAAGAPAGTTTFELHQFGLVGPVLAAPNGAGRLTQVTTAAGLSWADANPTGFNFIPYVSNAVQPNRMLLGATTLYESSNYLTTLNTLFAVGSWTALAYGGTKNGTARWEVVYAADGNRIHVRLPHTSTSLVIDAFKTETIASASEIRDIVLDPRDYTIAYAATDVGVFKRNANTGTWSLISQKLFNANFQSLEFVPGATPAQDVLLVGSALGIYRAFNPAANVAWTLLGVNMPNALVTELDYIGNSALYSGANPDANRILVVGTQGRGAWTLQQADVVLAQHPVLTITGSDGVDDNVLLIRNSLNPALLDVTMNGSLLYSAPILSLQKITFDGKGGNDTLTVDSSYGAILPASGVSFTGGAGNDTLVLQGGKSAAVRSTSVALGGGVTKETRGIDIAHAGGTETVVFEDKAAADTINIAGLPRATAAEIAADGLRRTALATNVPSQQLAIIGRTLPSVLNGSAPSTPTIRPADRPAGAGPDALESGVPETSVAEGLARLFTFDDGTSLLDLVAAGSITTTAELMTQLERLAGVGNVTNLSGSDTEPRIQLHLTKSFTGTGTLDVEFDKFGGHAALEGEVAASLTVHLNVVFGVDADGNFYVETNGADPELVIDNLSVDGTVHGEGRLGFLGVEISNASVSLSGVTVTVDIVSPTGTLTFGDLDSETIDSLSTITASGGPVSLTGDVTAQALLPGMNEPFDIGSATITATWADIGDPTNVDVTLSGALNDLVRARAEDFHQLVEKLGNLTDSLNGVLPAEIQNGLDAVVSVVRSFDENVVSALTDEVSGAVTGETLQDIVGLIATQLNAQLGQFGFTFSGSVLTWDFDLGSAGLSNLTLNTPSFQATLENLHFIFAIDFAKLVDLSGGLGSLYSLADALTLTVTGEIGNVNIADVFQGGLKFEVTRRIVDVDLDGGAASIDLNDALLMAFGLSLNEDNLGDPETRFLRVGIGDDYSLRIDDGALAVAVLSAPTPTTVGASDTRRWVTVEAHGFSGTLHLSTFLNAAASGIDVVLPGNELFRRQTCTEEQHRHLRERPLA